MNKTILIVEDEKVLLNALQTYLEKQNYTVLTAEDGRKGLEMALSIHPDLIISDVLMPEMDGLEMVENIRQDEWGKNCNVIFLTNINTPDHIMKAVSHNVFAYFIKSELKLRDLGLEVAKQLAE